MKKHSFFFLIRFLCLAAVMSLPGSLLSQIDLSGRIIDAASGEELPFCHIVYGDGKEGTVANEDGNFVLRVADRAVQVTFSYVGYQRLVLSAGEVITRQTIALQPLSISLEELVIYADDGYLYEAVEKCANVMNKQPRQTSRTHFHLSTEIDGVPNEMMECYYNTETKGGAVTSFKLKNGRAGLPMEGEKFFLNMQTTHAIMMLDVMQKSEKYPATPFHYGRKKMERAYQLQRLPTLSDTNTLHIAFEPIRNSDKHFYGEMWINKNTFTLQKVILQTDDASVYPFYSIGDKTRIADLAFNIEQDYRETGDGVALSHMSFGYHFTLQHPVKNYAENLWDLKSKCLLHFYDHSDDFILPYFEYDPMHTDYRMISFLPYDSLFWVEEHGADLSESQREQLQFFEEEGVLLNYHRDFRFDIEREYSGLFEQINIRWARDKRITFGRNASEDAPPTAEFLGDMINIEVQLYLDVNKQNDDWRYNSATILDIFKSYNYIGESPLRNCYANIYFDLGEIARREMIQQLVSSPQTPESIDEIYKQTTRDLAQTHELFNKEVQQGQDFPMLQKWNAIVLAELGIDNIKLHGEGLETQN